ncbi:MAG: PQQ-binding-like beta-propeller repeat protein [Pseudomonadota bacterium]
MTLLRTNDRQGGPRGWTGRCLMMIALLGWGPSGWAEDSVVPAFAVGLVANTADGIVYVMEERQLSARAMDDGRVVWRQADLVEPLAMHNGQLLVIGNRSAFDQPMVYWLDPRSGERLSELRLSLPDEVAFRIQDNPGEQFQAYAYAADQQLQIGWRFYRRAVFGAPAVAADQYSDGPSRADDGLNQANQEILDTTLVNATGVITIAAGEAIANPNASLPTSISSPWTVRLDASRGQDVAHRVFESIHQAYALDSQPQASDRMQTLYQWTILDDQNEILGQWRRPFSFAPFAVSTPNVLYQTVPTVQYDRQGVVDLRSLSLVVADLATGEERWVIPMLDKQWRGPMPH